MRTITFSKDTQAIIDKAQEYARQQHHAEIDSFHVLWSLLHSESWPTQWLYLGKHQNTKNLSFTLEKNIAERYVSAHGSAQISVTYIQIMRMAQQQAFEAHAAFITPDHLWRSIIDVDAGVREWLRDNGVDITVDDFRCETPILDQWGRDLTRLAATGGLPQVVGRENELSQIVESLLRQGKNSVLVLGLPGVGKTAVIEKLANEIARGNVPKKLRSKRLVELSVSSLVSGTTFRGELEQRLEALLNELRQAQNVILVIDEFHMLMGAGAGRDSALDASNILKPALARGELTCIGITTHNDFAIYIEKDQAFVRRFQTVVVPEATEAETLAVLQSLASTYSDHHHLTIDEGVLEYIVKLSGPYFPSRQFPDKAIDVLGRACSRAEISGYSNLTDLLVANVVTEMSGIPINRVAGKTETALSVLEDQLKREVIGQDQAVSVLGRSIRMAYSGLRDPKRPKGVFLFVGPSGVGKTQLARVLARCLMGDEKALVRLDMSEYSEKHSVSRLIGSPPGYVGYGDPGQLTQALQSRPHSVVLLDEVEKAHPELYDLFLQLFDEGRLTDARGQLVDARHSIFIMTSNIAPSEPTRRILGFGERVPETTSADWETALRSFFRPEFINRIDHVIPFRQLDHDDLAEISRIELETIQERLREVQVKLTYSQAALDSLARLAEGQSGGARSIKRVVEQYVTGPISDELARHKQSEMVWLHLDDEGQGLSLGWI